MLTFEKESWKDEEFSEEAFGSVLGKVDEGEGSPTGPDPPAPAAANKNKNKNNKNRSKPSSGASGGSSAEEQSANSDSLQKKAVSFSPGEVNPTDTDASSPKQETPKQETPANKKRSLRSRVSDREQRSRRRQALIVEEPEVSSTDGKRPRPLEPVTRVTKKSKSGVNEEVIKIPMLTGTLFLYRGLRRRAEFIRKY